MRRFAAALALVFVLPLAAEEKKHDRLWHELLEGNQAFVDGELTYDDLEDERERLRGGQKPFITVLACADSRVPPELVFYQSLGKLFVIREAGNVADEFSIATIEYILKDTRLLVVLGHENCGAVEAALKQDELPTAPLRALVQRIRASFVGVEYDNLDPVNVKRAVEANARASAAYLLAASDAIRAKVLDREMRIVTAYYDLDSGEVTEIK